MPDAPKAAGVEREAFCGPAHPMILAVYREAIACWVRQRREARTIEAEREVAYRRARSAALAARRALP